VERRLEWEALRNARDLGGLTLDGGGVTRTGALVRSETLRQLTSRGWEALLAHGISTVLDLRFRPEIDADEPLDPVPAAAKEQVAPDGRPASVRTIAVSLLGDAHEELVAHFNAISRAQPSAADSTRAIYLEMLELFAPRFATAVAAVADAPEGGVLVHCHAGKDRTGLVVALLLDLVGVPGETIATDYALSAANLGTLLAAWIDDAADPDEREQRSRVAGAPHQAMLDVLASLRDRYGGSAGYLLEAGATQGQLDAIRARLVA
jgi:protein tyrosine/serine phosphatase